MSETFRRLNNNDGNRDKLLEALGITDGGPLPMAIGMSWKHAELDIDLCIPNETLPGIRSILASLPFAIAPISTR